MKLSIIILTWNSEAHICKCLSSLCDNLYNDFDPFEIYIVDNGSTDRTKEIIEEFSRSHPDVIKPILLDFNTGTTYSRNLALKKVTGDYVAVIDSDVIVPPNFLFPLIKVFNDSPKAGMVVPKLICGNGRFQKSVDDFPTLITKLRRYFFLKKIEEVEGRVGKTENHKVDYAISAFWLLKKEVLRKVGLLDEKIFYAPEDVDYCLRLWKAGYEILYVPSCVVIHNAQEISRGFKLNRATVEHIKGLVYFFWKHRYCFKKPEFMNF